MLADEILTVSKILTMIWNGLTLNNYASAFKAQNPFPSLQIPSRLPLQFWAETFRNFLLNRKWPKIIVNCPNSLHNHCSVLNHFITAILTKDYARNEPDQRKNFQNIFYKNDISEIHEKMNSLISITFKAIFLADMVAEILQSQCFDISSFFLIGVDFWFFLQFYSIV